MYDNLVSVITPSYNSAKHLEKLIDCVELQSIKVLEHIIIDDGSSDNSLELLRALAEKKSHIKIISQKNQGAGPAVKKGFKKTRVKKSHF